MKKRMCVLLISSFVFFSCAKEKAKNEVQEQFVLNINISNADGNLSYLHKLTNSKTILSDSAIIKNSKVTFNGSIRYPERYLLTVTNVFGGKLIILENDTINVQADKNDLTKATISSSLINNELADVQQKSMNIYDKMDLFFPDLQRARLENDAEKLGQITLKMKAIEKENIDFNYTYARENPNSYISAMILNDLSKRDSIDIKKVKVIYDTFSEEVKKCADAEQINLLLSIH
ncbi:MAG: hypothetical protein ACI848_000564 [Roseivirga sp.]|jgi:hypothetical protein